MPANEGVFLNEGSSLRPTFDTAYAVAQTLLGYASFISGNCMNYAAGSQSGISYVRYYVRDTCGNSKSCNAYVFITCPNITGVNDNVSVYTNVGNTSIDVVANDNLFASSLDSIAITKTPTNGSAAVVGNKIVYTGNGSYVGLDTVDYSVCNFCGKCSSAKLHLNIVQCVLPVATDDLVSFTQGDTASFDLLANDSNLSFGQTTTSIIKYPSNGTASLSGAVFNITSSLTFYGLDTLTYQVCTDCGCDTGIALLNVAQAPCSKPTATDEVRYSGYSVGATSTYDVLANDLNPIGGGAVTVTILNQPDWGTASVVNNKVGYTVSDSTHSGDTTSFTYALCNQCLCDTATVSLIISAFPFNGSAPVVNRDRITLCRNDSLYLNLLGNDYDLEGSYLTLTDSNTNSLIWQAGHGFVTKVDSVTLLYTPLYNFFGLDTFQYIVKDHDKPQLYGQAIVFVTVDICSNAPEITLNGQSVNGLSVSIPQDSSASLCIEYYDVTGDSVTVSIGSSLSTITANTSSLTTHPCLNITPPNNFIGLENVWVTICDQDLLCDSVLLTINVTSNDQAPIAATDFVNYAWGSQGCQQINVLANDSDPDSGDKITLTSFISPTSFGATVTQIDSNTLCYAPLNTFIGTDTVVYVVCDNHGLCATGLAIVNVTIKAVNDSYTINQEQESSFDVKANDTRFDGEELEICAQPLHGAVRIDGGNIVYTPADDYPYDPIATNPIGDGIDSFCYSLCKSTSSDRFCTQAMVYVTIKPKSAFFIPQGISPNGDGVNDNLIITSKDEYPKSQLIVFNRYGDEVWRTDGEGYGDNFNGVYLRNGNALPDGTYFYIFKFNDGITKDKVDYITINR